MQQTPPTPPTPPSPDVAPAARAGQVVVEPPVVGPAELLQAMQARRRELREQLESLEEKRDELNDQVRENRNQGLEIAGLEARIKETDLRISAVDQQLAMADAEVARAAAVPGAAIPDIPHEMVHRDGPPEEVFVLGGFFIVCVMMPIAIAYARRVWKRSAAAVAAIPSDLADRLRGIEQAIEAMATEVERIGEGQRFMSRLFTERQPAADPRALGEGAAQPIDAAQRHKMAEPR